METVDDISSSPNRSALTQSGIKGSIAQLYYRHGLFCSSHPYTVICITLFILSVCCYPLIQYPLLGSSSQLFTTSFDDYKLHQEAVLENKPPVLKGPRWFQGMPVAYVQQVVIKSVLSPWDSNLTIFDTFRGPLAEVFHVVDAISNHQFEFSSSKSLVLSDVCVQVGEPVVKLAASLPKYSCLLVSPAQIWNLDRNRFLEDTNFLKTIFSLNDGSPDLISSREILFGVPWKETGIKKVFMKNRRRIVTYSITLILKDLNINYTNDLDLYLYHKYPSSPKFQNNSIAQNSITQLHIQDQYTLAEFVPLGVTYIILFLYIYFSVKKIELVKYKWVLAVSAVMTVVMSLLMSVGLCMWFGLNPTLNGSEVLPYLVVVIGLENMFVLTRSVISVPDHLDVKVRVAQGLSKEGWSITKNLLTELALLMVAFSTFVPAIQEFCLFAVVGLLSDFFLQLVFFATVLSIDIRKMETGESHRGASQIMISGSSALQKSRIWHKLADSRFRSPAVSHGIAKFPSRIFGPSEMPLFRLPKRLRFLFFWAKTRMIQRGLMVCLVVWIMLLVYRSGVFDMLSSNSTSIITPPANHPVIQRFLKKENASIPNLPTSAVPQALPHVDNNSIIWNPDFKTTFPKALGSNHWSTLFGYYNISLRGRYISILPPICISIPIDPVSVKQLRHVTDSDSKLLSNWKFLAAGDATDPDLADAIEAPFHPSSPAELAFAITLAICGTIFIVYMMVVLYRCMCSRNYAEWRSSLFHQKARMRKNSDTGNNDNVDSDAYFVMDAFPVKLKQHLQEIECISSGNNIVSSSCLEGNICVWDTVSGECLTVIQRAKHKRRHRHKDNNTQTSFFTSQSYDSTYSSSPESTDDIHTPEGFSPNTVLSSSPEISSPLGNKDLPSFLNNSLSSPVHNLRHGYNFTKFCTLNEEGRTVNFQKDESPLPERPGTEVKKCFKVVSKLPFQPIWCLACQDNWVVVGCSEGRVEVWDGFSGTLMASYNENAIGVTAVSLVGVRIIVARLDGNLEFLQLENPHDIGRDGFKRRILVTRDNTDKEDPLPVHSRGQVSPENQVQCLFLFSLRAHIQPVTILKVEGGQVVTGSQDHLVKVFRLDTGVCIYTLHGHYGAITALHIDKNMPTTAATGCEGGLMCVWDLLTGTCVYSLEAHHGAVQALLTTEMYIISQGTDDRICIWEKFHGHLLHTLEQHHSVCNNMVLLTSNIMVTAKEDHLVVWDVDHGEPLRIILLGSGDQSFYVRLLQKCGRTVVCDYGNELCMVHFPAMFGKAD